MEHQFPKCVIDYFSTRTPEGARNEQLLKAACQLRDMLLPIDEANTKLIPCAMRDGLTELEATGVIRSVYRRTPRKPPNLMTNASHIMAPRGWEPKKIDGRHRFVLPHLEKQKLPPHITDNPLEAFLRSAFRDGEWVNITRAVYDHEENEVPQNSGSTLTVGRWIEILSAKKNWGDWFRQAGSTKQAGVYVVINPMAPESERRTDDSIAVFRHVLVESDSVPIDEQWTAYVGSGMPISAVIHSGGKSLHAWVRVDASNRDEYNERREIVYEYFKELKIDPQNKNPSRLSRLPGVARGNNHQTLHALNIGASSWEEWISRQYINQEIGQPITVADLLNYKEEEANDSVLGRRFLYKGGSWVIVAQSGIGKSVMSIQSAINLALGRDMFGMKCPRPLRSLIIQAENDMGDMAITFQSVIKQMKIDRGFMRDISDNLVMYRDCSHTGEDFTKVLRALIMRHKPDIAWIDPVLSFIGDDINEQRVCSRFFRNQINPILMDTGCSVIMLHHTPKPPRYKDEAAEWSTFDFSYLGAGSSELTNWARAISVIQQTPKEGTFALRHCKRYKQTQTPSTIYIKHSDHGPCWLEDKGYTPIVKEETKCIVKPRDRNAIDMSIVLADCLKIIEGDGELNRKSLHSELIKYGHKIGYNSFCNWINANEGVKEALKLY